MRKNHDIPDISGRKFQKWFGSFPESIVYISELRVIFFGDQNRRNKRFCHKGIISPTPKGLGVTKHPPKPMKSPCRLSQPGKICFEKMCVRTRTSCLEKCLGFTKWFYLQVGYTKNNLIASLLGGESDFFSVRKTRENWDKSTKSRDHLKTHSLLANFSRKRAA